MTSEMRNFRCNLAVASTAKPATFCVALGCFLALAACSADVTRFDKPNSFSFDDPPRTADNSETARDTNLYDNQVVRSAPPGPYGVGGGSSDIQSEPLPAPSGATETAQPTYSEPAYQVEPFNTAAASPDPVQPLTTGATSRTGVQRVEIQRGDTLYGLSRRYNVSVADLMQANNLTSDLLRPGQVLNVPTATASIDRRPASVVAPEAPAITSGSGARYTVRSGDSLYKIARDNGIPTADLQRANNITNPRLLRPGQVLIIPTATSLATTPEVIDAPAPPTITPGAREVAALNDTLTDASPEPPSLNTAAPATKPQPAETNDRVANAPTTIVQDGGEMKLRWPVTGQVISKFGGRPDGTHNDGINLAVPLGAEVKAAEGGIVAYAGSELKGYGNLILIRHDNGWVTAYAHNDQLLVKRGDKVRRGQAIAKAGRSGSVDRPQVHFELRQGAKPVDPTPYMEPI